MWDDDIQGKIDPENKYLLGTPRHFEHIAARVFDALTAAEVDRTRDCIQLTESDERGVVVLITPDAIEIRLPTVEWPAPYAPIASSRLSHRIDLSDVEENKLMQLVRKAQQARQAEFVPCHYCKKPTPPEHRHMLKSRVVCHGCAERHEGIVH